MAEFYLTLPSNTEPGNRTGQFRVRLPEVVKLKGDWDVALAQIQYPKSWNNVTAENDPRTGFRKNEIYITIKDGMYTTFKISIPPSHYDTVNDLLAVITNTTQDRVKELVIDELEEFATKHDEKREEDPKHVEILKKVPRSIYWDFDPISKHTTMKFNKDVISSIRLSEHLQYVLGFEERDLHNWNTYKDMGKYPIDMRAGIDALYVYCDLVENQIIGNVREPLLRILPVKGTYGEIIDQDFVARHYVPVLNKEFSTVEISIKGDSNVLIPFAFGKVIVKLHFKKRK